MTTSASGALTLRQFMRKMFRRKLVLAGVIVLCVVMPLVE